MISTVLLVGASVAKCAEPIKGAGLPLQMACCALHLFGGTEILGSPRVVKGRESKNRTWVVGCGGWFYMGFI